MSRLLVATRSLGKQDEFRRLLADLPVELVFPDDVGIATSPEEEALEAFETFDENARAKARWFAARSGLHTLADDSGLEVDALGGAPGVHSKRFAGHDGPDHLVTAANNTELLRQLHDVPVPARTARYRCVLLWWDPANCREVIAQGSTEGRIALAPEGRGGFGYDPLFLSDDLGITFGQATAIAKHEVSHRGRAAGAMVATLRRLGRTLAD